MKTQLLGSVHFFMGHMVVKLVETLRYKLEGRGFDSRGYQ